MENFSCDLNIKLTYYKTYIFERFFSFTSKIIDPFTAIIIKIKGCATGIALKLCRNWMMITLTAKSLE